MKIGGVVILKSNAKSSPKMTIEEISGNEIKCMWFDKNGVLLKEKFQRNMLQEFQESANESQSDLLLG